MSSQALNYCPSLCVSAEGRVIIGILGGGGGGSTSSVRVAITRDRVSDPH